MRKERKGEYLNDKHNDGLCACGMQLQFGQCARNKTKLKMMKMPIHEVKKKKKKTKLSLPISDIWIYWYSSEVSMKRWCVSAMIL